MSDSSQATGWPRRYGRYLVFEEFARGGMASVHLGRLVADRGFSRLVAVKMLSQDRAAGSSSFYARALEDEARIASRVRHPNVVQALDVVVEGGDLLYVMEYVHGVSLAQLLDAARADGAHLPVDVAVAVMLDILSALHAAHEAKDETGRPLGVVHRDVSPHNVLVGLDGLARLADFGVAKAMRREERTATGAVKGKPAYMSPEQQRGLPLSRQADVYAAGVVLAVSLTGAPQAPTEDRLVMSWLKAMIDRIADRALRDVVVTATSTQARDRYATAAEMATALSAAAPRAAAETVGATVQSLAGDVLDQRADLARRVESATTPPAAAAPAAAPAAALAPALAPQVRRFPPHLLLLFGVALVLATFLFRNALVSKPPASPLRDRDSGPAWSISTSTTTSTTALAPSASEPPSPSQSPSPAPSASTIELPTTPNTTVHARQPAPRAPPSPSPSPSPSAPAVDCDPPFRIDAQGRKHYKPECAP